MDAETVAIYEREAATYEAQRPPRHRERAEALAARRLPHLPVLDAGCGPGGYLPFLGDDVVALDAAAAMLDLARPRLAVRADLEALPLRDRSLGAAWARNSYLHVRRERLPLALARLHWALAPGAAATLSLIEHDGDFVADDDLPGRHFTGWAREALLDVITGAGFTVDRVESVADAVWVDATRARSLPDTVAARMRVLVCGLNPSVYAADAGIGFVRGTNRFWRCAVAAGLTDRGTDPLHALTRHGMGMTDLVKRATPSSRALTKNEYREGAHRVRRMVEWLRPGVVLFVGLEGWRAAIGPKAVAGWQPDGFGGRPAYVMPSTSGINAHASVDTLVGHMRVALGQD